MNAAIRSGTVWLVAAIALVGALLADDEPSRSAVNPPPASASQNLPAAAPVADESEDLAGSEQAARVNMVMADARLELVLSRKALKNGQAREAAQRALRVQQLVASLPDEVDASSYELQAEGILARAQKAGVDVAALNGQVGAASAEKVPESRLEDPLDRDARAASRLARSFEGSDTPEIDTTGNVERLARRSLRNQKPDDRGYRPGREIFDTGALRARAEQDIAYQGSLDEAIADSETRRVVAAQEARVAPEGWVTYPDDWPQIVAKRARYRDGVVARSPGWIDENGREWYTAIYDIHDLTYVVPDFQPPVALHPAEQLRNELDRAALRQFSDLFTGYPEDLAKGIPLLRFFGGVDDMEFRGPKYSAERQEEIIEMIRQITNHSGTQPRISGVGP